MKASRLTLIAFFLFFSTFLHSENIKRDAIREHKIELQLDSIDASLTPIFKAATIAMDENKPALADSLYALVYQKAPDFDPVLRRLGMIRVKLGRKEEGIELGKKALTINRSAANLISLATSYFEISRVQNESIEYLREAASLLHEAENLPEGNDFDVPYLLGLIAIQEENIVDLKDATRKLTERYPDYMMSHYFAAIIASVDEDWLKAKEEILIAQKMGLEPEAVKAFLDSGVQRNIMMRQIPVYFLWVVGIWSTGLLLLFLFGLLLSKFTMRSLDLQRRSEMAVKFEPAIKSIYRFLINFSGFYYYISLPVILVLIVVLAIGLIYTFIMIGTVPIYLVFLLVGGAGFSIYGMIRSLLVKVKYQDDGRKLMEEEAPGLFELTREVANAIGTRPIDEIRITPFNDCAVYERGTWREKNRDRAQRILILGTGTLKDFGQHEFRAILAHEYGHFSHRDTAGGEVALRVQNDIYKFYYALRSAGQNVWWNVAFQFLRLYNFIFLRISHGASRLQEALADRVAAQTYGAASFQDGLTHLIKRRIEFIKCANLEINDAIEIKRPLKNLYELSAVYGTEVNQELQEELTRKTSPYDTHPSPAERFRYVEGIVGTDRSFDTKRVDMLFLNWERLTAEMTTMIQESIKQ
jgi:Zn-dependent protease with chaperone function